MLYTEYIYNIFCGGWIDLRVHVSSEESNSTMYICCRGWIDLMLSCFVRRIKLDNMYIDTFLFLLCVLSIADNWIRFEGNTIQRSSDSMVGWPRPIDYMS